MRIILLLLATIFCFQVQAQQAGDLDLSYGNNGIAEYTITVDGVLRGVTIYDTYKLPDGKLLAAGWAQSGCYATRNFFGVILRLNSDGSLDTTFQDGGYGFYGNSGFDNIIKESDNSLFVVGNEKLRKIDLDGNIDTTYGVDGTVTTVMDFSNIVVRADGSIILGGRTMNSAGKWELTVSKRFVDGSLDTNFGTDGYFKIPYAPLAATALYNLQLDSANRIVINGRKQRTQNLGNIMVLRLTPEGVLDTTFANNGIYLDMAHDDARARQLVIEDDGKMLLLGNGRSPDSGELGMVLSRLNPDGTLDTTYGTGGRMHYFFYSESIPDVIHRFEEGYVISGDSYNKLFVAKINMDGSLNLDFNSSGFVLLSPFDYSGFSLTSTVEGNRMIISANDQFAHCAQSKYRAQFIRLFLNDDGIVATAFPASDLEVCDEDNDGIVTFDLTQNDQSILAGQTGVTLSYHTSQADADSGNNAISDPTIYLNVTNPQTIFARVADPLNGDFDTTTFTLMANPTPTPFTGAMLELCDEDNDGFAQFSIFDAIPIITEGEPNLQVTFFETFQNATSGLQPLLNLYTNNTPYNAILYARVENTGSGCYAIVTLALVVNVSPVVPNNVSSIIRCDAGLFDLTQNNAEIYGSQSPAELTIHFFESYNDAETNNNAITDPTAYANSENPQDIYVRLQNNTTGCFSLTYFELIVGSAEILVQPNDLFVSDATFDGYAIFNLTENTEIVLNGQPANDFEVSYFETETDAQENINSIQLPETYQNVTNPQIIFVRKTSIETQCFAIAQFQIETDEALGTNQNAFNDLALYPNPATNMVKLVSGSFSSEVTISIYSMEGKLILNENRKQITTEIALDLDQMASGNYILKIVSENNVAVKNLVKK